MRDIGIVEHELDAQLFRDFLFNRGIECDVEANSAGNWVVWIHDENRMVEAESLLESFRANPSSEMFVAGAEGADDHRNKQSKEAGEFERKILTRENIFNTYGFTGIGRATILLIAISILVTILCRFNANDALIQKLSMSDYSVTGAGTIPYYKHLAEVRHGQIWRLVTPIFMHFNFIHILFNMMWLRDLGSAIEKGRSSLVLLLFVLITGILSNVGQYYMSGPVFGGMSGVIYGLLGYVWMQSKFNPWSGFVLHPATVQMMLVWFVLCLSGLIGNIANTAHGVGLVVGVLWGIIDARRATRG